LHLRRLASAYYAAGGLPITVTALLPLRHDQDHAAVVRRLRMARSSTLWKQRVVRLRDSAYYVTSLPDEAGEYRLWRCVNNSVGWVGRLSPSVLESRIRLKARKLPEYRQTVNRVALLLVVDRTRESGMLEWPAEATRLAGHGFDAVFLYVHPLRAFSLA
jgi:hypothetical protein